MVIGSNKLVDGGTGWAVQMAINNNKPVWLFEQKFKQWMFYYPPKNRFEEINCIPSLSKQFAGIGTRQIDENGKQAIKEILKQNIK